MWDEVAYPFLYFSGPNRWSLGMVRWFHPTLFWACDYLSMLGLKLIHVSKRGHSYSYSSETSCEVILVTELTCKRVNKIINNGTDLNYSWHEKLMKFDGWHVWITQSLLIDFFTNFFATELFCKKKKKKKKILILEMPYIYWQNMLPTSSILNTSSWIPIWA